MARLKNPSHPGEVLYELYLAPTGTSSTVLARHLGVPGTRIEPLVKGKIALGIDTALRFSRFFGTTAEFRINLQRSHDLAQARKTIDLSGMTPLAAV